MRFGGAGKWGFFESAILILILILILIFFFCFISMKKSSPFIWDIIYFCTMDGFFRILEKTSSVLICTRLKTFYTRLYNRFRESGWGDVERIEKTFFVPQISLYLFIFLSFLVAQIICKQANLPLIGNSWNWTTILVVPMTIFYFRTARSLSKKILGQEYFHPIFFLYISAIWRLDFAPACKLELFSFIGLIPDTSHIASQFFQSAKNLNL